MATTIEKLLLPWQKHYNRRFEKTTFNIIEKEDNIYQKIFLHSDLVKNKNHPRLFFHGKKTKDVIVLTHGLSDSPWYVESIAKRFFKAGANVLLPLLPAHGLKDPDAAFEDLALDGKWREEIDVAVQVAANFGERISIGGFSTGGALSYNKILRTPTAINGGLFLFAAALSIGKVNNQLGKFGFVQKLVKNHDGKIIGIGQDPYKYPIFPKFGVTELAQIITQNQALQVGKKITQPTFVGHSVHDESADFQGIISLLTNHVAIGEAFLISQNVRHAETPLEIDVPIDYSQKALPEYEPKANPQFEDMMAAMLYFFENKIRN